MYDSKLLYERRVIKGRTASLFCRLSIAFMLAVMLPSLMYLLAVSSFLFSALIFLLLIIVMIFTLFTILASPGFIAFLNSAGDFPMYSTAAATAVHAAYIYLMPVFAVLSTLFGVLAIVLAQKNKSIAGTASARNGAIVALVFTFIGVLAFVVVQIFLNGNVGGAA